MWATIGRIAAAVHEFLKPCYLSTKCVSVYARRPQLHFRRQSCVGIDFETNDIESPGVSLNKRGSDACKRVQYPIIGLSIVW